jgi:hypothetical protein
MLLTITVTPGPATSFRYLVHKHPERFQLFDLSVMWETLPAGRFRHPDQRMVSAGAARAF